MSERRACALVGLGRGTYRHGDQTIALNEGSANQSFGQPIPTDVGVTA